MSPSTSYPASYSHPFCLLHPTEIRDLSRLQTKIKRERKSESLSFLSFFSLFSGTMLVFADPTHAEGMREIKKREGKKRDFYETEKREMRTCGALQRTK